MDVRLEQVEKTSQFSQAMKVSLGHWQALEDK
jgi:hypothetical protein